jgi:hypothetical protein
MEHGTRDREEETAEPQRGRPELGETRVQVPPVPPLAESLARPEAGECQSGDWRSRRRHPHPARRGRSLWSAASIPRGPNGAGATSPLWLACVQDADAQARAKAAGGREAQRGRPVAGKRKRRNREHGTRDRGEETAKPHRGRPVGDCTL